MRYSSKHPFRYKGYRVPSARLQYYDYGSNGWYFVTLCTHHRMPVFGQVIDGVMQLSELGQVAHNCWLAIPEHFPFVVLDAFVVMPDHVHGLIGFAKTDHPHHCPGPNVFGAQSSNLASIVRGYKIGVTRYARSHEIDFRWQARYHDHVVRDDLAHQRIAAYIINNPRKWTMKHG